MNRRPRSADSQGNSPRPPNATLPHRSPPASRVRQTTLPKVAEVAAQLQRCGFIHYVQNRNTERVKNIHFADQGKIPPQCGDRSPPEPRLWQRNLP